MPDFYSPDLGMNPEDPFARGADGKLVRRNYWLDLGDRSLVMAMTQGVGANLTNEQKRAHLDDVVNGGPRLSQTTYDAGKR